MTNGSPLSARSRRGRTDGAPGFRVRILPTVIGTVVGVVVAFTPGFVKAGTTDEQSLRQSPVPAEGAYLPEGAFPLLEQILRDSVDRSWRMIEEGFRIDEARSEAVVAAAGRYPSVRGTFRYLGRIEDRDDFSGTRGFYQPQATLIARQPLYHWGAIQAQDRVGRLRAAVAEGNRAEAYRMLALAIRGAFLDLAVQQKAIDLAGQREVLARHRLSIARTRLEREEITPEQLKASELAAAEAGLAFEGAQREREAALRDFSRLSGFEPAGREWIPAGIPSVTTEGRVLPPGAPVRNGLGEGTRSAGREGMLPWEQISRARIQQAEEQLAVESARQRPRLDLVAGVAQDQVAVFDRADIDRVVYFAGVELTWNLFDGYETQGRRRAALARKRLETERHRRQKLESMAELERLEEEADWTAREMALAEKRLELAERNLSQREEDLARGRLSEDAMAVARVEHAEQELRVHALRAEYLMAVAEWLSQAGQDPAMDFYLAGQR